jgi:hypothetical protein
MVIGISFAQAEKKREAEELIRSESLNEDAAKRYITASLKREYASENFYAARFGRKVLSQV